MSENPQDQPAADGDAGDEGCQDCQHFPVKAILGSVAFAAFAAFIAADFASGGRLTGWLLALFPAGRDRPEGGNP